MLHPERPAWTACEDSYDPGQPQIKIPRKVLKARASKPPEAEHGCDEESILRLHLIPELGSRTLEHDQ